MILKELIKDTQQFFKQYNIDIKESEIVDTVSGFENNIFESDYDENKLSEYLWANRDNKILIYLVTKLSINAILNITATLDYQLDVAINSDTATEQ